MSESKLLTVVVPILNEEENLPVLYESLCQALDEQPEQVEYLFIDDGSMDGGPRWLEEKQKTDPRIRLVELSRNFGHQVAITAGIDLAKGDAVAIIDADMQDPPEVLCEMLAEWRKGGEIVYGVRKSRDGETFLKKLFAATFYRLFQRVTALSVPIDAGDFRLLDRKVIEALKKMRESHRYLRAMTVWVGFRQVSVEYDRAARHAGVTKYPVWRSLRLAVDGLTSFSGAPLRWMSMLGIFACGLSLLWFVRIVYVHYFHPDSLVTGWASTIAAILLMGGVQLICLGILGQYLSRTFEEVKRRPLYIVRRDSDE